MDSEINISEELSFIVDPSPSAIQGYALLAFIVFGIVGYFFWSTLFNLGEFNLLGVIAGLLTGGAGLFVTERALQKVLVSNRRLLLGDDRLSLRFKETPVRELALDKSTHVTAWYFITKRQSRVPKGWYVVAIAFERDEVYLPAYTLVSPTDFAGLHASHIFKHLSGKRKDYLPAKEHEDLRRAGEERRLIMAETARGIDGVELSKSDFETFIQTLQTRYPTWMPR